MRSDTFVARDVVADFDSVRKVKRKVRRRRLELLRGQVLERYKSYWLARDALETLVAVAWSEKSADALRHCYGGSSEARDAVLEAIEGKLIPEPYLCPYCLMRQPKSLDHFLPQADYPEFSILAWNLVLVCETCNRRKSNTLHVAPRSVLNPYFDPLPATPLLYADIRIRANRVRLKYRIYSDDPTVAPATLALAKRHLDALNLARDLVREGTTYIGTIANAIAAENSTPIDAVRLRTVLDGRMRGLSGFPVNSWQVAVIDAMEQDPDLLQFINLRIAAMPRPERARPRRSLQAVRDAATALGEVQAR